jgi:penicillin-binding protein 1A
MPGRSTRRAAAFAGALVAASAAAGAAFALGLKSDLPDVRALESYTPPLNTRVLARDGSTIANYGEQKRILLSHEEIPDVFRKAVVAVEDASFYEHGGIDFRGIARAAWHDLLTLSLEQGASTLTQQLSRNLFLKPEKTVRRKVQEMLLALEIERRYTKDEILRMYVNQVYMGHGRYGLEAASQFYFGKHARDLTLPEAALLAGILQRPESLTPLRNPEGARKRRSHVLRRMVETGAIDSTTAERAAEAPIEVAAHRDTAGLAPYFVEAVRRWLQDRYGDEKLYREGLVVRTTLDPALQEIANRAVDQGLRTLDKRQGWRGPVERLPAGTDLEKARRDAWRDGIHADAVTDAIVLSVTRGRALLRVGPERAFLDAESVAWTGRKDPAAFLRPGDVVRVRLVADSGSPSRARLEQDPAVEAALVALDPRSGEVLAHVGGFDFSRSEFDRAFQARRQAGSAFKPILYAAAIDAGIPPSRSFQDEPTVFVEPGTWTVYQPENYGKTYSGQVTVRTALEKSLNIVSVKLLHEVGYRPVLALAERLGVGAGLEPYPSLALGAFEVGLADLTAAYGAFANQGVRVEPHLVLEVADRTRAPLHRARPTVAEALRPETAYLMNLLLEGVASDGTGAAAAALGRPVAGKTGTTDDFTDAWFLGYTPDLVVGVWVGFDAKRSLGSRETGAQAALPIWMAFMESALRDRPALDFPRPPGVIDAAIDRRTGLRADEAARCAPILVESFLDGTEPTRRCSAAEHVRRLLPVPLQRFPLDEDGAILAAPQDLARALLGAPNAALDGGGTVLTALTPEGTVVFPVRSAEPLPEPDLPETLDPSLWVGADGRRASVILLDPDR